MKEAHKQCDSCTFEQRCHGRRRERAERIGYCRFHVMKQYEPKPKKKGYLQ